MYVSSQMYMYVCTTNTFLFKWNTFRHKYLLLCGWVMEYIIYPPHLSQDGPKTKRVSNTQCGCQGLYIAFGHVR